MAEERQHHKHGFSKWPHYIKCPHLVNSLDTSDAAKKGTDEHEVFAKLCRDRNEGVRPDGSNPKQEWALKIIESRVKPDDKIVVEEMVSIPDDMPMGGTFGYCDAYVVSKSMDSLFVFDYKSGAKTTTDYKAQLMGYAYAICETMISHGDKAPSNIAAVVLYASSKQVDSYEFSIGQLHELASDMEYRIMNASALPHTACSACRYCGIRSDCEATRDVLNACLNKTLVGSCEAEYMTKLTEAKSWIEEEMDRMKAVCRASDGQLVNPATGKAEWSIKVDSRGRMTKVDLSAVVDEIYNTFEDTLSFDSLIPKCSITKASFMSLMKPIAKEKGYDISVIEKIFDDHCQFSKPAERMVKE